MATGAHPTIRLGNAIKFTPGPGHIVVRVTPEGEFGRLTVKDSGQGIDPDFLPRVFDMFGQAAARAASKQSGLGNGLARYRKCPGSRFHRAHQQAGFVGGADGDDPLLADAGGEPG